MKIKACLSIGYQGTHETIMEVPDEELKEKTVDEIENYIMEEYVTPWSYNYIDCGYEVVEE